MRIKVGNTESKVIVGGRDNLLPFDVFKELEAYMAVPIEGTHFARKKHGYKGDGKRHFLSKVTGKFATGFLPTILNWCTENGVEVTDIENDMKNLPVFVNDDELDWSLNGGEWEARDKQKRAVLFANNYVRFGDGQKLYYPRGIYDIATNGGKTSIMASLIKNVHNPKVLVLVNSMDLFLQTVAFFEKDFGEVGRINAKYTGVRESHTYGDIVTVAMVQTLYSRISKSINYEKDIKTMFNLLFVDECHEAGGSQYAKLILKVGAGGRYFFSGTALKSSNKINSMNIVGLSGGILMKISKKELMDDGDSSKVKVVMHYNDTGHLRTFGYDDELVRIIHENEGRAQMIGDIIDLAVNKKVLINFTNRSHGEFMFNYVKKHFGFTDMEIVDGLDSDRRGKIQRFTDGTTSILFASNILKQGLNIHDINVLIYAQAGKAEVFLSQWAGRIERVDGVNDEVTIHDFYDEGEKVSQHSRKRIKFYEKEQFEITTTYEHKKGYIPKSAKVY